MASKGQINRAGDCLRDWWKDPDAEIGDPEREAVHHLWDFRSGFQGPLTKTAVGLRQFVERQDSSVLVAQRLKRLPQIIHKLSRFPDTKLARMEDIGGCRAVVTSLQAGIDGIQKRIHRNWDVKRVRDYISDPKDTGYRGVHIVVERDEHRIEIQLRTPGQQNWAEVVEKTASRLELPLKDGKGPDDLLEYFRLAAAGIARDELGREPESGFDTSFTLARQAVITAGYFGGTSGS